MISVPNFPCFSYAGPNWVRTHYKVLEFLKNGTPLGNANSIQDLTIYVTKMILTRQNHWSISFVMPLFSAKPQIELKANTDKLGQRKTKVGSELGPTKSGIFPWSERPQRPVKIIVKKISYFKHKSIRMTAKAFARLGGTPMSISTTGQIRQAKQELARLKAQHATVGDEAEAKKLRARIEFYEGILKTLGVSNG